MSDQTYNGWTNYETWNVALWLDNDQGSYNYWREQAAEIVGDTVEDRDSNISDLARQLEADIKENNPLASDCSMYADILSANLSEVDWYEIAQHYVDEAIEAIAA